MIASHMMMMVDDARPVSGICCSWICELQHQHLFDVMLPAWLCVRITHDAGAALTLSCQHPQLPVTSCYCYHYVQYIAMIYLLVLLQGM